MKEREIYSTPAIVLLELVDELPHLPLEAICLIFTIKRYKRCIDIKTFEFIKSCSEKTISSENTIYSLIYQEKKQLLLTLICGLYISSKIRETTSKSVQGQRDQRQLEKKRATLQKEVNMLEAIKKEPNSVEVSNERKKEINGVNKEIIKISNEIKKKANKQTVLLGKDADNREYWLFAGDEKRIYIRYQTEDKEEWDTYSTIKQINELLNVLIDKGINEKELKSKIEKVLPNISLLDPSATDTYLLYVLNRQNEKKRLNCQERVKPHKKKQKELPYMITTTLQKVQSDILEMEEEYWNFFNKKNIVWNLEESREQWVIFNNINREKKEYGVKIYSK